MLARKVMYALWLSGYPNDTLSFRADPIVIRGC
jgi:hypothetical protein